jgi:hypothetical protein
VPSALILAVLHTAPSVHQIRLPSEVPTTPFGPSTPTALPTLVTVLPSAEDPTERAVEDVVRDAVLLGLGGAELRKREVDVAVRGEPEVVRRVELLAFAAVGEDGLGAVLVAAHDRALVDLAEDQAALRIDDDAVGAGLAVDEELAAAFGRPALDVVARDVRE